jgi:hypothetical protein
MFDVLQNVTKAKTRSDICLKEKTKQLDAIY